jgi:magnesium-transporting ATPase (P-type)
MKIRKRPRKPTQGFRMIDGLVAIAVIAVGLVWARDYWGQTIASIPDWSWARKPVPAARFGGDAAYNSTRELILMMIYAGTTLAATSGVALVILRRVRRPKAPFWRARRPGALACLISTVILGVFLAFQAIAPSSQDVFRILVGPYSEVRAVVTYQHFDPTVLSRENIDPFLNTALRMPRWTGFVIAGAWLALAVMGRWRPERSWIDRFGRAIGIFWIVAALHFLFLPL